MFTTEKFHREAFRQGILNETYAYKRNVFDTKHNFSRLSNVLLEWKNCHCDHIIPFKVLVDKFLEWKQCDSIFQIPILKQLVPKIGWRYLIDNATILKEWRLFHKHCSILQLLTAHENMSKKRKMDSEVEAIFNDRLTKYQYVDGIPQTLIT